MIIRFLKISLKTDNAKKILRPEALKITIFASH